MFLFAEKHLQPLRTSVCLSLRGSVRSEIPQRMENEKDETDDVTMETYQTHLPWVKITWDRWELNEKPLQRRSIHTAVIR